MQFIPPHSIQAAVGGVSCRTMDMLTDNLAGVDPDEQMHIVRLVFHLLDYMPDSVEPIYHRFFMALENPAISPPARLLLLRLMAVAGGRFSFEPGELDWCSVISESFYDCITQAQDLHLCSWLVRSLADLSLRVSLQETTQRRIQEVCSDLRRYLEGTTQLLYKPPEIKEYYWCQWSYYTGFQHSGSSMTRHSPERTLVMARGALEDLIRFFQQNETQETDMRPRSSTIRSL
ncbi:uncharacterized protein LAESUDRAFT_243298 [Laetiporus sulphureus 93-53]|uniref:Uncharacterized protein n=1 Tax=Laetiporus sulphureus 93-53 TaxID=1314785 RepID=A0A165DLG1_9APHY|nr:uncharacterized protein LAESUDRAFT_243298 [Laetiporus sulphureus 93-53]KZT05144.1 hypothetical protein LAESUDRAFT_243298 [Laetiporus sulphureus 93-53]